MFAVLTVAAVVGSAIVLPDDLVEAWQEIWQDDVSHVVLGLSPEFIFRWVPIALAVAALLATWLSFGIRVLPFHRLPSPDTLASQVHFVIYLLLAWMLAGITFVTSLLWLFLSPVMFVWLLLLRVSGWVPGYDDRSATSFWGRLRHRLRWPARTGVVLLSALILLPLAAVYCQLATPTPIPSINLPDPNAYGDLMRLGEAIEEGSVPDLHEGTEAELGAFVAGYRDTLDACRALFERESQVPLTFTRADRRLDRSDAIDRLRQAFRAEAKLARMQGRTSDAVASYLDLVRLGAPISRGGRLCDLGSARYCEWRAAEGLQAMRGDFTDADRRNVIEAFDTHIAGQDPAEDVLLRDRAWKEHVIGWPARLTFALERAVGCPTDAENFALWYEHGTSETRLFVSELAVELYHSERGSYPERLDELVPEYLSRVPDDPYSGKPICYRRTSTGYVVYSVGVNRVDDGGRVVYRDDHPVYESGDLLLDMDPRKEAK
jgi:hypothetical protein